MPRPTRGAGSTWWVVTGKPQSWSKLHPMINYDTFTVSASGPLTSSEILASASSRNPSPYICPIQFSSVIQSCPTLCDPVTRSTQGLPVHHQLPEFTQTHVHRVSDAKNKIDLYISILLYLNNNVKCKKLFFQIITQGDIN